MPQLLILISLLLINLNAHAQSRFALVVGNEAYPPKQDNINDLGRLDNPRNDAADIATLLQQHGFTLVDHQGRNRPLLDASKTQMDDAVDQLLAKARRTPNSEVWFYFSGHGIYLQDLKRPADSANYLLPVGVNFTADDPAKIKAYAVNAHNIKERIETSTNAAKLMIIDACRDKLTLKESKGFLGGGEFRPMNPTNGMMVVHATLHSYSAWGDKKSRNSRFTDKLLNALRANVNESLALAIGQAIQAVVQDNKNYAPIYQQHPMPEGLFFSKVCLGECGGTLGAQGKNITVAGKTYIAYANGTALDTQTNLLWMRCLVGQTWNGNTCTGEAKEFNWEAAKQQTANFAGYSDWRIPTIEELRTLSYCSNGKPAYFNNAKPGWEEYVEQGKPSGFDWGCQGDSGSDHQRPTIVQSVFPNAPEWSWVWSGSPVSTHADDAWVVYFSYGHGNDGNRNYDGHVRLVRERQ